MNAQIARSDLLRGELRLAEPMARHTTWRVGGPADRFYRPADLSDLCEFLALLAPDEPLLWLGLGSNLLVRDGGIRGVVLALSGALDRIDQIGPDTLRVEAGVSCAKVARQAARAGLVGAEFLAGIPGTMGGALAMNAGAFGGETWPLVCEVETVDRQGVRRVRLPSDYQVGYRSLRGPAGEWFAACTLKLAHGDAEGAAERIRGLLAQRAQSQPIGEANAGSVFRNPPGDHAARLIEACGLKGRCIGKACVSHKHANFIINEGGAAASEIEQLIALVADEVAGRFGVRLEPEVRIVGEAECRHE